MERAKLKFTVIVLLVILNIILLGIVINQRSQAQVYEEAGQTQAMLYLDQHGISVKSDAIPWDSTLTDPRLDPEKAAFISEQVTTETWEIRPMRRPETLLVDFVTGLSQLGVKCSRIASITEGYVHTVEGERTVFTPVWTIITDNGSYRLDCADGTMKKY
jgi:regulatory protein YycI of two-component signal transduction system YycFG